MHRTLMLSNTGLLDGLVPDTSVSVPVFTKYTEKNFQKMKKLCIDFFVQV